MKHRPMIFSGQNPLLVRSGKKTRTSRMMKPQPGGWEKHWEWKGHNLCSPAGKEWLLALAPHGQPGDLLWVKEEFQLMDLEDGKQWTKSRYLNDARGEVEVLYRAGCLDCDDERVGTWKPAFLMPRWASRTQLEITDVDVQCIQDITEEDCLAEGIIRTKFPFSDPGNDFCYTMGPWTVDAARWSHSAKACFENAWEAMHGKGSWNKSCWVWVYRFRRVEGP